MEYIRRLSLHLASSLLIPERLRRRILSGCGINIGEGSIIQGGFFLSRPTLSTGRSVFINYGLRIVGRGIVTIADNVSIGPDVSFYTDTHPISNELQRAGAEVILGAVNVGNGSWIGARTTILPGCHVAEGCIIAAGSVVAAPTEPHGMYAGVPARRLKELPPLTRIR
jgi:maltose O-acetyltransferase